MQNRTGTRTAQYQFDSVAELARYVKDTPNRWGSTQSEKNPPEKSWDLGLGYKRAWELARDGWPEGAKQAQELLKALAQATPRPDVQNDFYGHMPHVPRFCAGAPDSMIRHTKDPRAGMGKVLTLYVPVNALASVSGEHMRNFGLGVAQYINQLETEGKRVEVHGALCSLVSGWRVTHTWRIKSADQPLDLAVLAFGIGHPAMFRRLGFALRERCAAPRDWAYGQSVSLELKDIINAPAGAIILNGMKEANKHAQTPSAALAYITKQIEKALDNPEAAA